MRLAGCSPHPKGRGSPKNLDRTCSGIPRLPDESAARPGEIARLDSGASATRRARSVSHAPDARRKLLQKMLGTGTEAQGPGFAARRLLLLPGLCSEELRFGKRSSYSLSSQLWCSNAVTICLPINSGRCRLTSNKTVFADRRHAFRARSAVWGADAYPGTGPRCSPAHGSRVAGLPATQSRSNNLQLVTPIAPGLSRYAQEETGAPLQPEWEAPHAGPLPGHSVR